MPTDVLIVGAGPTGLTMANLLARGGVGYRVIDKGEGPTQESRALVMHAKSLELLDKLGLAEAAVEGGRKLAAVDLFLKGERAADISFLDNRGDNSTPFPFALVHEQSATEKLLLEGMKDHDVSVEWNTELLRLTQTADGAIATIRLPGGDEQTVEARWVVGADGASSRVRHALGLGFEGSTYERTLFLADVEMEWALGREKVSIDLTREGFLLFFPMHGGRRFRLVGSLTPELANKRELSLDDVRAVVSANSGLPAEILGARWTSVYRVHRRMAERFRVGRVFLTGDAAHVHSPAGGQGMNTGIGDAYNLGWKLTMVARGEAHPDLLDSYEPERMPFARAILGGSDRAFALQSTTNPVFKRLRLLVVPVLSRALSFPGARRTVFRFVSQLWTRYRESPAVAESSSTRGTNGVPRAGDRAPYGRFEAGPNAGTNLFELLEGTGHHLLLFEGLRPGSGSDATEEDIKRLLDRYAATVSLHRVPATDRALHERYGAQTPSLFLVRPDGHIAYRGRPVELSEFEAYMDRWFEKRRRQGPAPRDGETTRSFTQRSAGLAGARVSS